MKTNLLKIFSTLALVALAACSGDEGGGGSSGEPAAATVANANTCGSNGGNGNPECCNNPSACSKSNAQTANALHAGAADLNNASGLLAQLDQLNGNNKADQNLDPNAQYITSGSLAGDGTSSVAKGFPTAPPTAELGLPNLDQGSDASKGNSSSKPPGGGAGGKLAVANSTSPRTAQSASLALQASGSLYSAGGSTGGTNGPKRGSNPNGYGDAGRSFASESYGVNSPEVERNLAQNSDPEDYFKRTQVLDNLFSLVSRTYNKVSLGWAHSRAEELRRARQDFAEILAKTNRSF